jgi:glycosyltransferase involved in cell wall biosynthesis
MSAWSRHRICIVPELSGVGGMVTFQDKFIQGLEAREVEVTFDLDDPTQRALLVIGGTRRLHYLWRARVSGIPTLQRLDGMNWLHRRTFTGPRHFLRAEWGNWLLAFIRRRFADTLIYQSEFARTWWERVGGPVEAESRVVHNGVDLSQYRPEGPGEPPEDRYRILLVEGSLSGGYQMGLLHAVQMASLAESQLDRSVELMVVGRVEPSVRRRVTRISAVSILWEGLQPAEKIPEIDRSAHLLYAADLNAACPNAVIEAMACGLPIVAFDTGALSELVQGEAGLLVPYGGDPWQLDPPDVESLASAAVEVITEQGRYRKGARARAEAAFALDDMVEGYLDAVGWA